MFALTRSRVGECTCGTSSQLDLSKGRLRVYKVDGFSSSCLVQKEKHYLYKKEGLGQKQVHLSPTKRTQPENLLHVILTHRKTFEKCPLFCNK